MKIDRKWMWAGGALAGAAVLVAAGVPLITVVLLAAVLACPAAMFLGMRGMQHGQGGMACHPGAQEPAATSPEADAGKADRPEPAKS